MAEIQDGGYSSGLYKNKWYAPHMFGCTLYIHNTKKACFVRLKGVHMPHTFGCPHAFGCPHMFGWHPVCLDASHMPPCMFGHPHMFGWPCRLGCPLCLDAPCMLGHPHMFRFPHMFGWYLDAPVHTQHKESMLCQTKGVSICPIHLDAPMHLDAPICLDGTLYVWMPPICLPVCLDTPICLDGPAG